MTRRVPTVLGFAIAGVLLSVALQAGFHLLGGPRKAAVPEGALSVRQAVTAPMDSKVVVVGYVFADVKTGVLLCSQRTSGRHPACAGEAATLEQLDTSRLDLRHAKPGEKGYDAWSSGRVALQVRARGATFVVDDILPAK